MQLQDIEELSLQAFASGSLLLTSKTLQSLHLEVSDVLYSHQLFWRGINLACSA